MTEDVIHMASTDARIRQEARLFDEEINAAKRRRLERLRRLLDDELYNMFLRCDASDPTITYRNRKERAAPWLHGKTFDQTYRDWAERSKRVRTRERIEALLKLCGGDKTLLLNEYTRTLNRLFPIPGTAFQWAPKLIQSESGRVTVLHKWARIKKEILEDEEE